MDDVETANQAVVDAEEKAVAAREAADHARHEAALAAQDRADAAEAAKPKWQTIYETLADKTERLIMEGGYLLRSSWRTAPGSVFRGDPLSGSSMTFVAGEAPPALDHSVLALTAADVLPGVDPVRASLADVHPITQIASAPEVILWLPDGKVKILKSRDPKMVGVIRDVVPADGVAPKISAPTPTPPPPPPPTPAPTFAPVRPAFVEPIEPVAETL